MSDPRPELRLLVYLRPDATEPAWDQLAQSLHSKLCAIEGRLLSASSRGLCFDFPSNNLKLVAEVLRGDPDRPRYRAGVLEARVDALVSGEGWAFSTSNVLDEAEGLAEQSGLGEILAKSPLDLSEPEAREAPVFVAGAEQAHKASSEPPGLTPMVLQNVEQGSGPPESAPALSRVLGGDASGDSIRRLKQDKQKAKESGGSQLCKASLSLSIALSRAGRHREAAFEALEGLAQARLVEDAAGEKACAALLSQVAKVEGDAVSSDAWGRLAR